MSYNYLFEIAAVLLLFLILYDYRIKMRVYRPDGIVFQLVILTALAASIIDIVSSIMIANAQLYPIWINLVFATLYFVLQATMIFSLAGFSFLYMNPQFGWHRPEFWVLLALYIANLFISVVSPWTGWYFYFDETRHYVQGVLSNLSYYFYYINVAACLFYALYHRGHILKKDLEVAGWIAVFVWMGVSFQLVFRSILLIGFSITLAVLYLYMTLENPNDYQDKLTHCTNNYGFKLFINSRCTAAKAFTVMFLDVKKFRYVNAIYGMENGNYLLQSIVFFLEKSFPHNLVFRVNDDVFAVTIVGNQSRTFDIAKKIKERFQRAFTLPDRRRVDLEAVLAICEYPKHFRNHTELQELRGYLMKKVKENHKGNILYADQTMTEKYRRREGVEHVLRKALKEQGLQVHYQPIFDSRSQKITTVEALSRLQDEVLGNISPDEFIQVAEKTGLIIRLGFYVLEEVCTFLEKKVLPDPQNTITTVHVNMSMLQCAYPAGNMTYMEIIKKHHIPPEMIHFELTESTMVASPDMVRETMQELIETGIHFSLDDYGTGYSNISYLVQFPFDKVKFDKQMVWSYFENDTARTIMKNEFQVFHTIGKDIIVEGIETEEQFKTLEAQNIHLFQGYYFSRPVSGEKCLEIVHKWSEKGEE